MSNNLFSSPSAAVVVIMSRSANGLVEWNDQARQYLKSIETNEILKQVEVM
jgi:hypothetical protein